MLRTRQELPLELSRETYQDLVNYLNNGGVADLAEPLDYLLEQTEDDEILVADETGEFSTKWLEKGRERILIVRSNLGRLAGLHLNLPVQRDEYQLGLGPFGASISPRLEQGHKIGHYAKLAGGSSGPAYGDPNVVVRVQQIAADELWRLSGL